MLFAPGPNMGWTQIGEILAGIFANECAVFDFCDEISIRHAPRFISFEINLIISGVFLVGVESKT